MSVAQIEAGKPFNKSRHDKAWQDVLYTHFHDILTGSCVQDSREHAMGNFSNTLAYANTQYGKAVTALASMVDTSSIKTDSEIELTQAEGAGGGFSMSANIGENLPSGLAFNNGVPNPERGCGLVRIYNIFNPLAIPRKAVTELTVWDWVGDLRRIQFKDAQGNPLRFQLLDSDLQVYWDHRFVRILVECDVPALGYTTIVMSQAEATGYTAFRNSTRRSSGTHDDYVLENELVKAVFDRITGCLISFVDKETGIEYIDGSRPAGLSVITMQRIGTSAWNIGKYLKVEPMNQPVNIDRLSGGDLRKSFTATYKWGMSSMKVTPMLLSGEKAIRFNVNADWSEVAGETVPLLVFDIPLSFNTDKYLMDVPAGAVYRQSRNDDMPGLQYCAAIRENGTALALVTDSKYGYRANDDHFGVSLINTSTNPDPYPDRGQHIVNLALAISRDDARVLETTASMFNHCTHAISNNSHPGTLPMGLSFLEIQAESTVLSSVLPTEKAGTIRVRFYETCGKDDTVVLKLAKAPASAVSVDLFGMEVPSDIAICGNDVRVSIKSHCIGQVELKF
jgi:alpha-mannosidase